MLHLPEKQIYESFKSTGFEIYSILLSKFIGPLQTCVIGIFYRTYTMYTTRLKRIAFDKRERERERERKGGGTERERERKRERETEREQERERDRERKIDRERARERE